MGGIGSDGEGCEVVGWWRITMGWVMEAENQGKLDSSNDDIAILLGINIHINN